MLVYILFRFNFVFIFLFAFESIRCSKLTYVLFNLLSLHIRVDQRVSLQDAYLEVILRIIDMDNKMSTTIKLLR